MENKIAYAKVKLFGSDEQIKKDFAIWLEEERKRRNTYAPKKNFSENAIDSWHEFSILPYLDLSYWAKLENVKISQHVMGQAIFPDAYSLYSDIDPLNKLKTSKKIITTLMDLNSMYLLWLQCYE